MRLKQKLLPWRPALVFTGQSFYSVDAVSGRLASQTDVWDAIKNNSYPSVRAQTCVHAFYRGRSSQRGGKESWL